MATLPGKRSRQNSITGALSANLSSIGASFTSSELDELAVISGDHAIITFDPFSEHGDPEIVMVTAHASNATSASITRGMYGSTARLHPQGTLWVHAAVADDFIPIVTTGTHPTDNWEGQIIYESDTDTHRYWDGVSWASMALGSTVPRGVLGSAYKTSGTVTLGTSPADVTGLSVTVNTIAARRYRVSAKVRVTLWDAGAYPDPGKVDIFLMDSATELSKVGIHSNHFYNSENTDVFIEWTGVPGAASKTYKIQAAYNDSTQPAEITGNASRVSYVLVEDIGI